MTTAPSANDLTRQQLEELDALLQRMLAAPGPKPDVPRGVPAVPPVVESWRIDRPAPPAPRLHFAMPDLPPAPVPTPTYVPSEPPLPPTAPAASLREIELEETVPVTPAEPFFPAAESIPEAGPPSFSRFDPTPIPLMPSPMSHMSSPDPEPTTTIETPVEEPAAEPSSGIPVALWPVFAVNWVAEECLKAFGGEGLTRPAAKWTLAGLGVLMMAAAAAWILQGYGIVSFVGK